MSVQKSDKMTSSNPSSLSFCDSVPSVLLRHSIYAPVLMFQFPEASNCFCPWQKFYRLLSSARTGTWRTCCTSSAVGCLERGGGREWISICINMLSIGSCDRSGRIQSIHLAEGGARRISVQEQVEGPPGSGERGHALFVGQR